MRCKVGRMLIVDWRVGFVVYGPVSLFEDWGFGVGIRASIAYSGEWVSEGSRIE